MFLSRTRLVALACAALLAQSAYAAVVRHSATNGQASSAHKLAKGKHRSSRRVRGQQAIEPERVTQIQQALIRERYLTGDANGNWDATTVAAMQKYQADHGWQTKLMPDSRALMKLGLGPDYSSAINAKDGNFSNPGSAANVPSSQAAGFAAASGVNQ